MTVVATAAEAFDRYSLFFQEDRLIQSGWHSEVDGRHLACGLGVLGDEIDSPRKCPATIMPRWLAQMVPWLFDTMAFDDAKKWGLEFYAELKRLDGKVPFTTVYDWHANVTTKLAIEYRESVGKDAEPHRKLQALHLRALAGDRAPKEEWRASLPDADADADAYADAYADADADAYADADADAYAYAYAYAYAKYRERVTKLAFGLVECLRRVAA